MVKIEKFCLHMTPEAFHKTPGVSGRNILCLIPLLAKWSLNTPGV